MESECCQGGAFVDEKKANLLALVFTASTYAERDSRLIILRDKYFCGLFFQIETLFLRCDIRIKQRAKGANLLQQTPSKS